MEDIKRDIIELAVQGDMEAFERIYKACSGLVYSIALRITNNRQDAQEVTQDVFIKLYHNIRYFEFRSSFKTWVYRIALNTALNAYKSIARDRNRRQDYDSVIDTQEVSHEGEAEIIKHEARTQAEGLVQSFLDRLNPDQRACITLREIEGLSYQEIADILKTNINTVRSRLKRARQALMEQA